MRVGSTRILIVGSHADSGFSMLNFTRGNFVAFENHSANMELHCKKPLKVFSRISLGLISKKYSVYLDKFVLFAPYLFFLVLFKQIQVVHVLDQGDAAYRFFVSAKCKFIVTVHDLFAILASENKIPNVVTAYPGKMYQRLISRGLERADLALAISCTTESEVKARFPGLPTQVIYNFVDNKNFLAPAFEQEFGTQDYFLILMNSHWRKDRRNSIVAWKSLLKFKEFESSSLIIIGNALGKEELELISHELLPRVSVLERLNEGEIANYYHRCIGVINISNYEGFGLPIIEANINGRICVYGGSETLREIAGPYNIDWAQLEESKITTDLTEMILSPINRRNAYDYVQHRYSIQNYLNSIYKAYVNL